MSKSRITLCAGLMALATTIIVADTADAGGRRGQRFRGQQPSAQDARPDRASRAEALGLTEDQQAQMQALHESFRTEDKALRESLADADRDARHEAFEALRESRHEQVQALLTDEQNAQLEAFHTERLANRGDSDRRRGHRGADRGGERPDLGAALGLSEDQSTQIQSLRTQLREQMQSLRASGEGSREQAQALRQAHHEQVQSLLTEEQRIALEELRGEHRRGPRTDGQGTTPETGVDGADVDGAAKAAASIEGRSWGSLKSGRR